MHPSAQLAYDTILQEPTRGIATRGVFIMEHDFLDDLAGVPRGTYRQRPEEVYLAAERAIGVCLMDQFIPRNPLTMGPKGYDAGTTRSATTGAEHIVLDGVTIDSPEAVVEHLERFVFPALQRQATEFDAQARSAEVLANERRLQELIGPTILKTGYGFVQFPSLAYFRYGYENYFMAYALYPEVMERHFSLQADLAERNNRAVATLYADGLLPPLYRLDHDMADGRGTLVSLDSLKKLWLGHFARSLAPLLETPVRLIWHCDGNLMGLLPLLVECGVSGFQGFQYEHGMDYPAICRLRDRQGREPIIQAGVSVTTTLPHGSPDDVRAELRRLVEFGPSRGLFLGTSSSMTPGVPRANLDALIEGLRYYREHGR